MSDGTQHLRIGFTAIHLLLVCLGSLNLLLIILILSKPYLRSITNVYMLGLCLADFIYLTDLVFVAATSLNGKNWPFGQWWCSIYHGTETTAKYASVLFITLLAVDRYFAVCKSDLAKGKRFYRSYKRSVLLSTAAWAVGFLFSAPLFLFAEEIKYQYRPKNMGNETVVVTMCIVHWPGPGLSTWYIGVCSVVLFIIPGTIVFFAYYQVFCKLRDHIRGSRRLQRTNTNSRYRKVTQMVQRVVIFHLMCWSPFWMFNLFSTVYRVRLTTVFERFLLNILHLFPYINCAINPILYAYGAENFRQAFREIILCAKRERNIIAVTHSASDSTKATTVYRNSSHVGAMEVSLVPRLSNVIECASVYDAEEVSKMESEHDEVRSFSPARKTESDSVDLRYDDNRSSTRSLVIPSVLVTVHSEGTPL